MSGVNKVFLLGFCGKAPECKEGPSGVIARFSLATSESWKSKDTGEKMQHTEWHNCVVFGPLAKVVQSYVKKGSKLYVEGKLQTTSYEKDGIKRYSTQVNVRDLNLLDKKEDGPTPQDTGDYEREYAKAAQKDYSKPVGTNYETPDFEDDQIPF